MAVRPDGATGTRAARVLASVAVDRGAARCVCAGGAPGDRAAVVPGPGSGTPDRRPRLRCSCRPCRLRRRRRVGRVRPAWSGVRCRLGRRAAVGRRRHAPARPAPRRRGGRAPRRCRRPWRRRRSSARYEVGTDGRDGDAAVLSIANESSRSVDWVVELTFDDDLWALRVADDEGISVRGRGNGEFVLQGTRSLDPGGSRTLRLRLGWGESARAAAPVHDQRGRLPARLSWFRAVGAAAALPGPSAGRYAARTVR